MTNKYLVCDDLDVNVLFLGFFQVGFWSLDSRIHIHSQVKSCLMISFEDRFYPQTIRCLNISVKIFGVLKILDKIFKLLAKRSSLIIKDLGNPRQILEDLEGSSQRCCQISTN